MPKRLKVALAAAVFLVLAMSAQGTAALWRAEGPVSPGVITTGSLSLAVGNGETGSQNFAFTQLAATNLTPGGMTQAPLTVGNTGTVDLRYALAGALSVTPAPGAADIALAGAVELSVYAVSDSAACAAGTPSGGTALYKGPLGAAAVTQLRSLATSSAETLCISVALPANAPQTAAGGALTLELTWRGDQL